MTAEIAMGFRSWLPDAPRIMGRAYMRAALQDLGDFLRRRRRPPLVPPARFDINGVGEYLAVGDAWARRFETLGLSAAHDVMEIGCGTGRIARAMAGKLQGRYTGFDVLKPAVDWAASAFAPHANFRFVHLDVYNDMYNPRGRPLGAEFRVPIDSRADFIFALSLFTHVDPDVTRLYLQEVARLKIPGGTFVSSWYLYDAQTLASHGLRYSLPHDFGCFRRQSLLNPALVVAYDEEWVRHELRAAGFGSIEIMKGTWRGGGYAGQDVIVAR